MITTPVLAAHNGKSQIQTEEPADHSSAQETTSTHQHNNVTDVNHAEIIQKQTLLIRYANHKQ